MVKFFDKLSAKRAKSNNDLNAYGIIMRHMNAPPMTIDMHVDSETFEHLQKLVEETWSRLGQEDAHWSVITDEKFRKDRLKSHKDEFFKMGEGDIARVDAAFSRVGASLSNVESVMDFGCGVGRLSIPLARKTKYVLGVDISAAHLHEAKANIDQQGCGNIELFRAECIDDIRKLPEFELVYSIIVLQHNPPPVMLKILDALCSRVKPDGYLYVQAQTYRSGYSYSAKDHLENPSEEMEMHILPQHVFLGTIQDAGLTILEIMEDGAAGDLQYTSQTVLARKR